MQFVNFGNTGFQVSRLGFGGAPAGLKNYLSPYDPNSGKDRDQVLAALQRALDHGITYFDTAAGYGDGASERLFGEGLKSKARAELYLASKFGVWKTKEVRRELEATLERMQIDYLDLLQVHGTIYTKAQIEMILKQGGYLDQMEALREEGLVRHIGFTGEGSDAEIAQLLETGRFDAGQFQYNFCFQHPCNPSRKSGLLYQAQALGMATISMRGTTSGLFQRWIQQVNPANDFDYTPALIQFNLSNPLINVVLVGMRTPEEVDRNVALLEDRAGRIDLQKLFESYV